MPSAIALFVRPNDNERMLGSVLPNREQRERISTTTAPLHNTATKAVPTMITSPLFTTGYLASGGGCPMLYWSFEDGRAMRKGQRSCTAARKHRVQLKGRLFRLASPVRLRCLRALWCSAIAPAVTADVSQGSCPCSVRERASQGMPSRAVHQ